MIFYLKGGGTMKGADLVSCTINNGVGACGDYYVPWQAFNPKASPNLLGLVI